MPGSDAMPRGGVHDLVRASRAGSRRATARLLSLVEDGHPAIRTVMAATAAGTGRAQVIGVTGPPGVGKSTTTAALVRALREDGQRVAVLAVDPSSPFTGGALLGDRVRMQQHAVDPAVFVRSMATRGHLGGLARAAPQALRVLEAAGWDVILVETVGVGQSEVEIAGLADSTVVLLAPGMGDGVQAAKAGVLEIGDVFVVNKADRDGAETTARELRQMLDLGFRTGAGAPGGVEVEAGAGAGAGEGSVAGAGEGSGAGREPEAWRPPVLSTVANRGTGIDALVRALTEHHLWARDGGELRRRRMRRAAAEIEALTLAALRERIGGVHDGGRLSGLAARVAAGDLDPYTAADDLRAGLPGADQGRGGPGWG
ncbi:MAG: methylmalonyl Co-A mutase-associated GTPase MeaB [Kineosporiaceae bacterium]